MIYFLLDNATNTAGTERAVINLANTLREHGHDVALVSIYTKEGCTAYTLSDSIAVIHLGLQMHSNPLSRKLVYPSLYRKVKDLLIKHPKALFIGTNIFINTVLSHVRHKNPDGDFRVIGCEHISYDIARPVTKKARGWLYAALDAVVALTERDRKAFESVVKGKTKVRAIPNQVSFSPQLGITSREPLLLAIGRLTYQKAFEYMVEDVTPVLRERPSWRLIIVGEGEDEPTLKDLIRKEGMEDRILIRPFTNTIETYYRRASIYLMTSRYEGLPMVLLEAQAYGMPIVSYDCPTGPQELIRDGENGYLVPMRDKSLFSQSLLRLIDDPNLRQRMSDKALEMVRMYGADNIYAQWLSLFEEINYRE